MSKHKHNWTEKNRVEIPRDGVYVLTLWDADNYVTRSVPSAYYECECGDSLISPLAKPSAERQPAATGGLTTMAEFTDEQQAAIDKHHLAEAMSHLRTALLQVLPDDDQIIVEHIKGALVHLEQLPVPVTGASSSRDEEAAQYVIVADGEGAGAQIVRGDLHQAVHDFMCFCSASWRECKSEGISKDLQDIGNADEWVTDENGDRFAIHWRSETGTISLYRLSAEANSLREVQPRGLDDEVQYGLPVGERTDESNAAATR